VKLAQYRHEYSGQHSGSPPNDAATATEPAVCPAAVAIAAKPLAPIIGTRVCNVGTREVNPAAIAGAAKPVGLAEKFSRLEHIEYTTNQYLTFQMVLRTSRGFSSYPQI